MPAVQGVQGTSNANASNNCYHKYNVGTASVSTVTATGSGLNAIGLASTDNLHSNNNNMIIHNSRGGLTSTESAIMQQRPAVQYSANFWENYEHLCALQSVMPLQNLKPALSADSGIYLQLNGDKLKSADWDPLLNTVRVNRSLNLISIYSKYKASSTSDCKAQSKMQSASSQRKVPAIRASREKTNKLCRCLKDCLVISQHLASLELYNIPINVKDCSQIAKGLKINKSIKTLSLDRCLIGDEGVSGKSSCF